MFPKRPLLWLVIFSAVFFLINYFVTGSNYGVGGSLLYALATGALALGFFYVIDKIRARWFGK